MSEPSAESERLPSLPPRGEASHKGDFGRALLIGGAQGMAGAIALAGSACLRSGAGLVRLAVPRSIQSTVAGFEPSYMTVGLADDRRGRLTAGAQRTLAGLTATTTVAACGPGLGRSVDVTRLVAWLYRSWPTPLVVDADGLNALAVGRVPLGEHDSARILTPHEGEFRRLVGPEETLADRAACVERASRLAAEHHVVVLLKGPRTLITDGTRQIRNTTGNPGLATGGTGDVLTGIITALLAQGLDPFESARLAAHVHGMAGDRSAERLGNVGMIARDLLVELPGVWQHLEREQESRRSIGFGR